MKELRKTLLCLKIYFSKNQITNYSRLTDRLSLRKNIRELNRPRDKI